MTASEPEQLRRFGRFEIRRTLGAGAFATVYEADLVGIGGFRKPVALKVLKRKRDPTHDATLLEEARLGAWLHHPNVVETYDVGEADERMYVAMELVDGLTVRDLIQRLGQVAPGPALALAEQCCAALHYAHELRIRDRHVEMVHRDVKPANVLVDRSGRVRLADFGVAWARGFTEDTTVGAGTPGYVAPESIRVERPDRRCDVFSLGVVLAEMVTGRRPWPTQPFSVYEAATRDPEAALRSTGIGVALDQAVPGLRDVVLRCLAPEPSDRFPTALALSEALARLPRSKGEPSLAELVGQALSSGTRERPATPPGRAIAPQRTNLPEVADLFCGRNGMLRALASLIGRSHVVTLTGVGGMGKTRVAVHFGWSVLDSFAGGVWLVDCTDADTREGLLRATAAALGVAIPEDEDTGGLYGAIAASLESRGRTLVILDNFDKLVHCAEVVAAWSTSARQVRFLVTSRQRTLLADEETVVLEPLSEDAAIELFRERARAHDPSFDVPEGDIRDLVAAVHHIPLAIELAAARARGTTTRWLRDQLTDKIAVFRTGNPVPERHATMQATVEWSWELLDEVERSALMQVSVFRGGFAIEAAVAVLDVSPWPGHRLGVALIEGLLFKSLLRSSNVEEARTRGEGSRLSMYDMVHRFASLKLSELTADEVPGRDPRVLEPEICKRHCAYYSRFGDAGFLRALFLEGGVERQRRLSLEHENLTVATRRAVEHGWVEYAIPLCRAVVFAVRRGAPSRTAERLIAAVLRLDGVPLDARATLLVDRAELRGGRGRVDGARVDAEEALLHARESGAGLPEARALRLLGNLARLKGDLKGARRQLESALRIARGSEDRHLEMQLLSNLGRLNHLLGRVGIARKYYAQALRLAREVGGREFEGLVLGELALLDQDTGRSVDTSGLEAALAIHVEVGNRNAAAVVLSNLGNLLARLGRLDEAREAYTDAIQTHRELGNRRSEAISKVNLGNLLVEEDEEARRLLTEALATFRRVGDRMFEAIAAGNLGDACLRAGRLSEAEGHLTEAVKVARAIKAAAVEGAFRGSLAMIEHAQGRADAAQRNLGAAESLLRRVHQPEELGKLLLRKGTIAVDDGDLDTAGACLTEVRELAASEGQGAQSQLARTVRKLEALLARAS